MTRARNATTPATAVSVSRIGHSCDRRSRGTTGWVVSSGLVWSMLKTYSGSRYIVKQYTGDRSTIYGVKISRRQLLIGGGCAAAAAALGIGGADVFDHAQFERGLYRVGLASSPTVHLPNSGAVERNGILQSRFMNGPVHWTVSHPPGPQAVQGIIFCLHGKGTGHGTNDRFAFDSVHVPDAAAYSDFGWQ